MGIQHQPVSAKLLVVGRAALWSDKKMQRTCTELTEIFLDLLLFNSTCLGGSHLYVVRNQVQGHRDAHSTKPCPSSGSAPLQM
jgi:hypothetical protein